MPQNNKELIGFWDSIAADWEKQVGDEGDSNRRLNSDPVLWDFAGDVNGLTVLDAGCGTGYLSRKLQGKGAVVTGVDFSAKMIEIARQKIQGIDFHVDSCLELRTLKASSFDMIVSNYVLMDLEDLSGAMKAFNRVLKPDGIAILVFSHPCFPQGYATVSEEYEFINYEWNFNYFKESRQLDPAWGHFTSDFIWFHRPLSDYWKAFKKNGFDIIDFEEPRITEDRYHLTDERGLRNDQTRPYSVAFKIKKKKNVE